MVVLRDGTGRELATVAVETPSGTNLSVTQVLTGGGTLLRYFFHEGRRNVVLDDGEVRLRGSLRTRWSGGNRSWVIVLTHAAGPTRSVTAGDRDGSKPLPHIAAPSGRNHWPAYGPGARPLLSPLSAAITQL